jgi:hypothetical protein
MARFLTFVPVVTSLVAFIAEASNKGGWWVGALDRASLVLVALAIAAALASERRANTLVLAAQIAAAATAVVLMAISLVKLYGAIPAFGLPASAAYPWANEAQLLGLVALAFGLTLARRRNAVNVACLIAAIVVAFGSAVYAIILTQQGNYATEGWWWIAIAGAFLAAAAASTLERDGIATLDAPVAGGAGGEPGSDAGVE